MVVLPIVNYITKFTIEQEEKINHHFQEKILIDKNSELM